MRQFKKNIFKERTDDIVNTKSISLGYAETIGADACSNFWSSPITRYIPLGSGGFLAATVLYQNATGTIPAQAGFYSDGAKWRYWNGKAFTFEKFC